MCTSAGTRRSAGSHRSWNSGRWTGRRFGWRAARGCPGSRSRTQGSHTAGRAEARTPGRSCRTSRRAACTAPRKTPPGSRLSSI
eukprot:3631977-Pyramimonas_sp.AAC.1